MTDVMFDNLQNEIFKQLNCAQKSVKIAVAWINFEVYKKLFRQLLTKGIKLKIVVNDDFINRKYDSILEDLVLSGAKIKKFCMASHKQYMHEKFMIIDSAYVCFGSYNWSINANKNFEYLAYCDEQNVVDKFKYEFNCLLDLSKDDIIAIQKPPLCEDCGLPVYNVGVISQEDYHQTRFEVYRQCGCGFEENERYRDFYNIFVYDDLCGIYDDFSESREKDFLYGIDFDEKEEEMARQKMDMKILNYLAELRHLAGDIHIHAVGVYSYRDNKYDDGGRFVKILWKEKFTMANIGDEYDLY